MFRDVKGTWELHYHFVGGSHYTRELKGFTEDETLVKPAEIAAEIQVGQLVIINDALINTATVTHITFNRKGEGK